MGHGVIERTRALGLVQALPQNMIILGSCIIWVMLGVSIPQDLKSGRSYE